MKNKKIFFISLSILTLLILVTFGGGVYATDSQVSEDINNVSTYSGTVQISNDSNCIVLDDEQVELNNVNVFLSSKGKENLESSGTVNQIGNPPSDGVYYVNNNSTSNPDGSYDKPFSNITSALTSITSASWTGNFTINIAPGTYTENSISLPVKNITFQRTSGETGEVIINGAQKQIFTTLDTESVVSFNFINLTLTNATAENGGVICSSGGPNVGIYNCKIENNTATGVGGAIYILYGNVNVNGSEFINNTATDGGGAIFSNGNIHVTGSEFINNTANSGGAIYNYLDTKNVNVTGSCFVNNTATPGQGNAIGAGSIKDVSGNWWGNNTPNGNNLVYDSQQSTDYTIPSYVIMTLNKNDDTVIVSLKLNNSDVISDLSDFISRNVSFYSNNIGLLNPSTNVTNSTGVSTSTYTYKSELYHISACIDNQVLTITNENQTSINASLSNTSTLFYGMDENLTILLYDTDGNLLKNMNVSVQINNGDMKIYNTSTDGKGVIINLKDYDAGSYTVSYNFTETGVYLNSSNKTSFTINPQSTCINTTETSYTVNFGTGADVIVNLYYSNGSLFTGETINCTVYNGSDIVYSENITSNTFIIPSTLGAGDYTLKVSYIGNTNYAGCFNTTNLKVNPNSTFINSTPGNKSISYGTGLEYTLTVYDSSNGEVVSGLEIFYNVTKEDGTIIVSNTTYNSKVSIPSDWNVGVYYVNYRYNGSNSNYTTSFNSTKLIITQQLTSINASLNNKTILIYKDDVNLIITLYDANGNPLTSKLVIVYRNGTKLTGDHYTDSSGQIIINLKDYNAEDYNITYTYEGTTGNYNSSTNTTLFTINPQNTKINTTETSYTFTYKEYGNTVTVNLFDKNGGVLTNFKVKYNITDKNNVTVYDQGEITSGSINIPTNLTVGEYYIHYKFSGNENYTESVNSTKLIISKQSTIINCTNSTYNFIVGSTGNTVTVNLFDKNGGVLTGKLINYTINNKNYSTNNGVIIIPDGLNLGTYTLSFNFTGDENYTSSSNSTQINIINNPVPPVSPIVTVISGEDIVTNQSSVNFTVSLKTVDGDVLSGENVLFIYYNGEYHPVNTDKNGIASVTLTGLSLGSYNIRYVYNGNNLYAGSSGSNTILVTNFIETKLSISNYTNFYGVKGNLTGRLIDINGNPLVNQSITLNLTRLSDNLSKVYNVSTDSNGDYYLEINLNTGEYSVSAFYNNKTIGNITYNSSGPVNANIKIYNQTSEMGTNLTVNDYTGIVNKPGNLTGRLLDINGNPISGQIILLDIQGVNNNLRLINTSITNSDGYYNLGLNLPIGEYTVSATYNGTRVNNITYNSSGPVNASIKIYNQTINTNTVLNVNNLTETYGQSLNLTGTLLDLNGKPVIGMHISLNLTNPVNGLSKIYHATTDNKGEYQLEINLYPGEYSVSATFNGLKTNTTNYLASGPVNSSILVNKLDTVLSADKFQEKYGAGQNFTGKLVNSKGEAVIGQHISLKLTRLSDKVSKFYYATTDTNGEYQLPINLFKGEYTAECSYTGTNIYTSSNASNSIIVTA
jgi:predicted outer membrane repeat protein